MNKIMELMADLGIIVLVILSCIGVYEKITDTEILFNRANVTEVCYDNVTYLKMERNALTVKLDVNGKPFSCKLN